MFEAFEILARRSPELSISSASASYPKKSEDHPFDGRSIHPNLWNICKSLFDDGHYSQATFEAFKYVDNQVKKLSNSDKSGYKLMMSALSSENPAVILSDLTSETGKDIQKGFQFLFSGGVMAIRNPRGHEVNYRETIEECLDHLGFASLLLKALDSRISPTP